MLLKVIACEVLLRETCFLAAQSPQILDLEFLPQGYHDAPATGKGFIQERIDAVPAGKYAAILLGYGLCGNILDGIIARHTPLVIPRAHDCITYFLGSRERYQERAQKGDGAYYYTAGWLECLARRGEKEIPQSSLFLPSRAGLSPERNAVFAEWAKKYGEEEARYLLEEMDKWTQAYHRGVLIEFDFTRVLGLRERVQKICAERGWEFEEVAGDLGLLRRWLAGEWDSPDFLVVRPGEQVAPSYDALVMKSLPPGISA